jgi:protease-4
VWALAGVAVGFGLPILALIGLIIAVGFSAAQLTSDTVPSAARYTQISGPESGPAVAVLDVVGPIVSGSTSSFETRAMTASGDLVPLIRHAAGNPDVAALVLRLNSPGGSVVGSDEIYHALRETQKPVVAFLQEVAASGAYYISMAAGHVVANPNSLTGSIGVIGQFPNAEALMEKIGVQVTTIKSGASKDLGNPFRAMNDAEQAIFQDIVDETYGRFVDIVARGRNLPEEQVRQLADGRIYTGQKALKLGLVDALGYQPDAIAAAVRLGNIDGEPRILHYHRRGGFLDLIGASGWITGATSPLHWLRRLTAPSLEYRWEPKAVDF